MKGSVKKPPPTETVAAQLIATAAIMWGVVIIASTILIITGTSPWIVALPLVVTYVALIAISHARQAEVGVAPKAESALDYSSDLPDYRARAIAELKGVLSVMQPGGNVQMSDQTLRFILTRRDGIPSSGAREFALWCERNNVKISLSADKVNLIFTKTDA